jgi:hypothetical protein
MDLFRQMSDDQLALIGCAGALAAAFTVMAVSYHVGRLVRGDRQEQRVLRLESRRERSAASSSRPRQAA